MSSLVVGLAATSMGISQGVADKAVMIRVDHGKDFANYYLDPPYWSYRPKGFRHQGSSHWLYKNHRDVFIDIQVD
jgi:hypothetical protein